MSGDHSDNCLGFLTILDNDLTFEKSAGGKEAKTGLSLNQEASQKELEGTLKWLDSELHRGALAAVKAPAKNILRSLGPKLKR